MTTQQTTRQKLAKILRDARKKSGMTQAEVGRLMGYQTPQFISILEREQSKMPLSAVGKMVKIFKLDENEIADILVSAHRAIVLREMARGARELK